MRIAIKDATAAQMRNYVAEKYGIDVHHTSNRASMLAKLRDLDPGHGEDIDLKEDVSETALEPETGKQAEQSEYEKVLTAAGMPEDEIKALFDGTYVVQTSAGRRELPTGPEADKLWCTLRLARSEGVGGNDPVPVGLNGRIQLIPRGEDVEVRVPYVEVLQHAQKIIYDEVMEADGIRSRMVPRVVPNYPIEHLSAPYEKAHGAAA